MKAHVATARLEGPPSITAPLHLDSLLLAARERRDGSIDLATPLGCLEFVDGVYRASAGFLLSEGPYGVRTSHVGRVWRFRMEDTRHTDAVHVAGDAPTKHRKIGPMSPLRPRLRAQPMVEGVQIVAWHFVGDGGEVLDLLRELSAIGASTGTGRGHVHEWDVQEAKNPAEWHGLALGGKAVRNLPMSLASKALGRPVHPSETTLARVAPPYWDPTSRLPCVVPSLVDLTWDAKTFETLNLAA